MAFTKAPMGDTQQNKRIPLLYEWQSRAPVTNAKDTKAVNVVFEPVQDPAGTYYEVYKRDGYKQVPHGPILGSIWGVHHWVGPNGLGLLIIVTSQGIYAFGDTMIQAFFTPLALFNDPVNFTEFLYDNGTQDLVIASRHSFGTLTQVGAWTTCADPDRPLLTTGTPVFLDGYLFMATSTSIYNSDLNNPQSWTAGNILDVDGYADGVLYLSRVGNYICAIGQYSTQFFYDAANPTGTPLAVVSGGSTAIGGIGGFCTFQNSIYFLGKSQSSNVSLWQVEGLKVREIPNSTVQRWVSTYTLEGGPLRVQPAHILILNGHRMYSISTDNIIVGVTKGTRMFDLDQHIWSELELNPPAHILASCQYGVWQPPDYTDYHLRTVFCTDFGVTFNQLQQFAHDTYQDGGANFTCTFQTTPQNFDTHRIKFGARLVLHADQTSSNSNCSISWSDDDYQTFSTPRTINLNSKYKQMYALGSFRERAFKLTYSDNFPMRWRMLEIDYDQGQA